MRRAFRLIPLLACCLGFASPALAGGFFKADLSDAENVPPFTSDTNAEGRFAAALFHGKLRYTLNVSNLPNAFAAHIHCGAEGAAGPPGVTLFLTNPGAAVTLNGTIAHGPILAPDRSPLPDVENPCGWEDLDDVVDALRSGDTYVNVHTLQSLAGEIRGQIR